MTWRNLSFTLVCALTAVFGLTGRAIGQPNSTIAYQGFLSDDQGNPINDPALPMRFTLHDSQAGGSLLWNETHGSVAVSDGVFTVHLGTFEPLDGLPFGEPLFLGVRVGTIPNVVTLEPRIPLTAVAYSLRSRSLDDGAIVAGGNVSIDRVGDALQISAVGGEAVPPSALAAPDGNPSRALVVSKDGHVGVGTSAASVVSPMHIRSDSISLIQSTFDEPPTLSVEAKSAAIGLMSGSVGGLGSAVLLGEVSQGRVVDQWSLSRDPASGGGKSVLHIAYGSSSKFTSNESKLALTTFGFLGLGTDDPEQMLHLRGDRDAAIILEADTDNSDETDNPALFLRQDGNAVNAFVALEGKGGSTAKGTLDNALIIGSEDNDPAIQFVTNSQVRMTIDTDGSITGEERNETLTIIGAELLPESNYGGFLRLKNSLTLQNTGKQNWSARIRLPDGAVVEKVTVRWVQSSFQNNTKDMVMKVVRLAESGLASEDVIMAEMLGKDGEGGHTSTDTSIQAPVIDNRHIYKVEVEFPECPNAPIFNNCFLSVSRFVIDYTTDHL